MKTKVANTVIILQPIFPMLVYFSVLIGSPPLWLSLTIATIPLIINYWYNRRIFKKTLFDIPIILFVCGTFLGFFVSTDKGVAVGAIASTLASILIYYGITNNSDASKKYWFWTGGIMCFITLVLSFFFLSQSEHRVLFFNGWAFNLFAGFPKINGPIMQLNTIGALLAVMIPSLFVFFFNNFRINLRVIVSVLCLFFVFMLLISDSGAGWLAVIIGLAFILVCWRKWLIWVFIPTAGLLTGAAIIFYDKYEWLRTTFSTGSLISRVQFWQNTLVLLKGKAIFWGLGTGSWYQVYFDHFKGYGIHVHNSYLQLYCDAGLLGFIAMVLAVIIFIRFSIKVLKLPRQNPLSWIGIGLIGTVISGAVFSIFDVTYSVTHLTDTGYIYLSIPLLWIAAALVSVMSRKISMQRNISLGSSSK
jgi:O-antigen ligase